MIIKVASFVLPELGTALVPKSSLLYCFVSDQKGLFCSFTSPELIVIAKRKQVK